MGFLLFNLLEFVQQFVDNCLFFRYSRVGGFYQDFLDRVLLLTRKLQNQGLLMAKLKSSLGKFFGSHGDLVNRYGISVRNRQICQICRCNNLVLASYDLSPFFDMSNMTSATSRTWTAFDHGFQWCLCLQFRFVVSATISKSKRCSSGLFFPFACMGFMFYICFLGGIYLRLVVSNTISHTKYPSKFSFWWVFLYSAKMG